MVMPCICTNTDEIRRLLALHGDELSKEKQEVKIAWKGAIPLPTICLLRGYEPPGDGEYSDTLWVYAGGETVYIISPSQITHFEVLATKRMTPDIAYKQMKEMERAGGLK